MKILIGEVPAAASITSRREREGRGVGGLDSLGGLGGCNPSHQKAVEEEEDRDWGFGDFGVGLKSASRTGGCRSAKDEIDEDALG